MMAGIAAISGKFGNMYFRTDKKSGGGIQEKQKTTVENCYKSL